MSTKSSLFEVLAVVDSAIFWGGGGALKRRFPEDAGSVLFCCLQNRVICLSHLRSPVQKFSLPGNNVETVVRCAWEGRVDKTRENSNATAKMFNFAGAWRELFTESYRKLKLCSM